MKIFKNPIHFVALLLVLTLAVMGFGGNTQSKASSKEVPSSSAPETSEPEKTAILYVDGTMGNAPPAQHEFSYTGELTVEKLADGLSEVTGYDFSAKSVAAGVPENTVVVTWDDESALFTGEKRDEANEEYIFFNSVVKNWFMLDSLYLTILRNLEYDYVIYATENQDELVLSDMVGPGDLSFGVDPYMGSTLYTTGVAYNAPDTPETLDGFSEEMAMGILASALSPMHPDAGILPTGGTELNGEAGFSFSVGKDTPEKFTTEAMYIVTASGDVFIMDVVNGSDYIPFVVEPFLPSAGEVSLYFVEFDDEYESVYLKRRVVSETANDIQELIDIMIKYDLLLPNTKVNSFEGTTIDMSKEFADYMRQSGSSSDVEMIMSFVNTVCEFAGIEKLTMTVNGSPLETSGGDDEESWPLSYTNVRDN